MKAKRPNGFGKAIERFFREYLPTMRGMSQHTIRSYRDAIVLFLRFVSSRNRRRIEELDLSDVTAERVGQFLSFLEVERNNGISTRNARLAALHTFARFLAAEQPAHLAELQRILGVPFKRGARNDQIEYLERKEADALLRSIDRSTRLGQRDYALFALMLNTGARVQEILDLRLSDVRTEPPHQVRLRGKGGKTRLCPIWPQTAAQLRELADRTPGDKANDTWLFVNRRGAKLTRFGVRYLLTKYIDASAKGVNTLKGKRIHPHSLRHTTASANG
jgi:site-specific recombinase XerD